MSVAPFNYLPLEILGGQNFGENIQYLPDTNQVLQKVASKTGSVKQNGQNEQKTGEPYANLLLTSQRQELMEKPGFVRIRESVKARAWLSSSKHQSSAKGLSNVTEKQEVLILSQFFKALLEVTRIKTCNSPKVEEIRRFAKSTQSAIFLQTDR